MIKDKYGVEIKVGDFVLLDHGEGREYPNMNSGQMVQIKKIGSKRIYYDRGMTNLYKANFNHITAYKCVGEKIENGYKKLLMIRKATNKQILKYEFANIGSGDAELRRMLLKNVVYNYKNKHQHYAMENKAWCPTFASHIERIA